MADNKVSFQCGRGSQLKPNFAIDLHQTTCFSAAISVDSSMRRSTKNSKEKPDAWSTVADDWPECWLYRHCFLFLCWGPWVQVRMRPRFIPPALVYGLQEPKPENKKSVSSANIWLPGGGDTEMVNHCQLPIFSLKLELTENLIERRV